MNTNYASTVHHLAFMPQVVENRAGHEYGHQKIRVDERTVQPAKLPKVQCEHTADVKQFWSVMSE